VILAIIPDFTSLVEGEGVNLRSEVVEDVEDLFDTLESHASPGLKRTLRMVKKDMKNRKILKKFGITSQ
jgi:hypothetical protein